MSKYLLWAPFPQQPPRPPIRLVSRVRPPSGATLYVDGETDMATVAELRVALRDQLADSRAITDLCVDVDAVSFIDVKGIKALELAAQNAGSQGIGFIVTGCPPFLLHMLDLLDLRATLNAQPA